MDSRWTGRNLVKGNKIAWEEVPPVDLSLRLNDVLQYEDCNTDNLWEAIRDWMEARGITRPQAGPVILAPIMNTSQRAKPIAAVTQAQSAMQLTRLVYTSQHENLDAPALESILTASRRNNARDLVTGVLVVDDVNFMQLIEGSRHAIAKCFERIMDDKCHHDVQVICCGDVSRRLFQDWSMRLVNLNKVKREILAVHSVDGKFQPRLMSEFAIEEFCRALAVDDFEVSVA